MFQRFVCFFRIGLPRNMCVFSLSRPEFETLGLEPWESSLEGRPALSQKAKHLMVSTVSNAPTEESLPEVSPSEAALGGGGDSAAQPPPLDPRRSETTWFA